MRPPRRPSRLRGEGRRAGHAPPPPRRAGAPRARPPSLALSLEDRVRELAAEIPPVDEAAERAARSRHLGLAKPQGSLGRLEELSVRLAGMAGECPPPVAEGPAVVVCTGDHGVLGRGVSPWPQAVTAAMVS